jgi:hypothetical protein
MTVWVSDPQYFRFRGAAIFRSQVVIDAQKL